MTNQRQNIEWSLVVVGLVAIICFFCIGTDNIDEKNLITKSIVLKNAIKKVIGNRSRQAYFIDATDYKCTFCISTPGGMAAKSRNNLENIKASDTLTVKIHARDMTNLQVKSEEVAIYALEINGKPEFSVEDYNFAKQKYSRRWRIISLVFGAIILFRGLAIISSKASYIVGGLSFVIILALRLLKIDW